MSYSNSYNPYPKNKWNWSFKYLLLILSILVYSYNLMSKACDLLQNYCIVVIFPSEFASGSVNWSISKICLYLSIYDLTFGFGRLDNYLF